MGAPEDIRALRSLLILLSLALSSRSITISFTGRDGFACCERTAATGFDAGFSSNAGLINGGLSGSTIFKVLDR